jgi:hypothetical protein
MIFCILTEPLGAQASISLPIIQREFTPKDVEPFKIQDFLEKTLAYLFNKFTKTNSSDSSILVTIFSARSVVLLLGGFVIGALIIDKSWNSIMELANLNLF